MGRSFPHSLLRTRGPDETLLDMTFSILGSSQDRLHAALLTSCLVKLAGSSEGMRELGPFFVP